MVRIDVRAQSDPAAEAPRVILRIGETPGEASHHPWLADVAQDRVWRQDRIGKLGSNPQVYTEAEDATIAAGTGLFDAFAQASGMPKEVRSMQMVVKAQIKHDEVNGRTVGMAQCTVRAPPEDVAAWLMHPDSRFYDSFLDASVDVRTEILEDVNDHHRIHFFETKAPPIRNRTFLSSMVVKRTSDDPAVHVWVLAPILKHKRISAHDERHAVRAEATRSVRLTGVAHNVTFLEYACTLDLKGHIPRWITSNVAIPNLMLLPYTIQRYFQQILPGDQWTADDGRVAGRMLVHAALEAKKLARGAAVSKFALQTVALRDAPLAHLDTILRTMLAEGGHSLTAADVVKLDPKALTVADGKIIGEGVTPILRGHTVPANAVDELVSKYAALTSTAQTCVWFRPMLEVVVTQLLTASLGARLRQTFAASTSVFDVCSNIYSMAVYFLSGQFVVGFAILGMVLLNTALQAGVVVVRNAHRGVAEVVKEVLIVLSFFKPLVDMRRMMSGYRVDGAPFDTYTERNYCKMIESAVESYPSCIIQIIASLFAYQLSGSISWAATVSILSSWLTTALKVTSMEFGADTNKGLRKYHPSIFGYSLDSRRKRRVTKAFLFSLVLSHVILTTLSIALVYAVRPAWLAAFLGTDTGLFLAYKAARSDLRCYIPGASGIGLSILFRAIEKLFVDFTAMPYFRSPLELGGAYWLLRMVLHPLLSLIAGWVYVTHFEGPGKLPSDLVFAVLGVLVGAWAASFTGFLLTIKREYIGTFISLETGCAYAVRYFHEAADDDERRIKIFLFSPALWSEIRGDVKAWTLDNFGRWKAEKADWFTVGLIKRLPDDFMPPADLLVLDAQAPGGKRRSFASMGPRKRLRSALLTPAEDAADATLILIPPVLPQGPAQAVVLTGASAGRALEQPENSSIASSAQAGVHTCAPATARKWHEYDGLPLAVASPPTQSPQREGHGNDSSSLRTESTRLRVGGPAGGGFEVTAT
jgi:hypothetical protein